MSNNTTVSRKGREKTGISVNGNIPECRPITNSEGFFVSRPPFALSLISIISLTSSLSSSDVCVHMNNKIRDREKWQILIQNVSTRQEIARQKDKEEEENETDTIIELCVLLDGESTH